MILKLHSPLLPRISQTMTKSPFHKVQNSPIPRVFTQKELQSTPDFIPPMPYSIYLPHPGQWNPEEYTLQKVPPVKEDTGTFLPSITFREHQRGSGLIIYRRTGSEYRRAHTYSSTGMVLGMGIGRGLQRNVIKYGGMR